jgi:hypothetical protein
VYPRQRLDFWRLKFLGAHTIELIEFLWCAPLMSMAAPALHFESQRASEPQPEGDPAPATGTAPALQDSQADSQRPVESQDCSDGGVDASGGAVDASGPSPATALELELAATLAAAAQSALTTTPAAPSHMPFLQDAVRILWQTGAFRHGPLRRYNTISMRVHPYSSQVTLTLRYEHRVNVIETDTQDELT